MTKTHTEQTKKYPFLTRTSIELGWKDRLRLLIHGKLFLEVHSQLENDPGVSIQSSDYLYVPGLFASKPETMSIG